MLPSRCFHFVSDETGYRGRVDVIFNIISASTATNFPLLSGRAMLKFVTLRDDKCLDVTPILLMLMLWLRCSRQSRWARHFVMKEADEAESSNALAWVVEPSGPTILTQQVMSKTWRQFFSWETCIEMTTGFSLRGDLPSATLFHSLEVLQYEARNDVAYDTPYTFARRDNS